MNFTLTTTIGDVDLLGEVAGVGAFSEVDRDATLSTSTATLSES